MDSPRRCTRWLRALQQPPPSWRRSDVERAVEQLDDVLEVLRVVSSVDGGRSTGRLAREARAGALDCLSGCHALLSALDSRQDLPGPSAPRDEGGGPAGRR